MVMAGETTPVHLQETSVQDLRDTQFTIAVDALTVMVMVGLIQKILHHPDHTVGPTMPLGVTTHGSMTKATLAQQENIVRICIRGQKTTPQLKISVENAVMSNGVTVMAMAMVTTIHRALGIVMPSRLTPHNTRIMMRMDTEIIQMETMRTIVQPSGAIQL